jgi:hypothetical protein
LHCGAAYGSNAPVTIRRRSRSRRSRADELDQPQAMAQGIGVAGSGLPFMPRGAGASAKAMGTTEVVVTALDRAFQSSAGQRVRRCSSPRCNHGGTTLVVGAVGGES